MNLEVLETKRGRGPEYKHSIVFLHLLPLRPVSITLTPAVSVGHGDANDGSRAREHDYDDDAVTTGVAAAQGRPPPRVQPSLSRRPDLPPRGTSKALPPYCLCSLLFAYHAVSMIRLARLSLP
jgi:hypothetical protein